MTTAVVVDLAESNVGFSGFGIPDNGCVKPVIDTGSPSPMLVSADTSISYWVPGSSPRNTLP